MTKEKKQKAIEMLTQLHGVRDVEVAHSAADEILLSVIGDDEIREAYEKVPRWYA
jgi:hypothetical protein